MAFRFHFAFRLIVVVVSKVAPIALTRSHPEAFNRSPLIKKVLFKKDHWGLRALLECCIVIYFFLWAKRVEGNFSNLLIKIIPRDTTRLLCFYYIS